MPKIRRMLVPTDFSASADRAYSFALCLAQAGPATIHLLHDVEIPTETITGATIVREELDEARAESARKMQALLSRHTEQGASHVGVEQVIKQSTDPVRSILVYAETNNMNFIVMGTHGRTNLKEQLIGSTTERVVHEAHCPVVTVRAQEETVLPETIARILVPVDFSEYTAGALRHAREIAADFDARLTLLHAGAEDPEEAVRQKLQVLSADAGGPGGAVDYLVSAEAPADAIVALARETNSHLIVMASHGRKGLKRVLTGNIADEVVRKAPCPVMVIRTKVLAAEEEEGDTLRPHGRREPIG